MRKLALALILAATPLSALADEPASAPLEPPPSMYDQPRGRPSGFWTSTRPAKDGAYRYRLLGIGLVFAAGGGLLVRHVIKKANAERGRGAPTA